MYKYLRERKKTFHSFGCFCFRKPQKFVVNNNFMALSSQCFERVVMEARERWHGKIPNEETMVEVLLKWFYIYFRVFLKN